MAILDNYVTGDLDRDVASAYETSFQRLSSAGALLSDMCFASLDRLSALNRYGFSPIEAFAAHRGRLEQHVHEYDPRFLARIRAVAHATAADYIDLCAARAAMLAEARYLFAGFDGFLMPTVPIAPPLIATFETDERAFALTNALVLRTRLSSTFLMAVQSRCRVIARATCPSG